MIPRIVVFAKSPAAGFAKPRLTPARGAETAARLAGRMLQHTLQQAIAAAVGPVELCVTPQPSDPAWQGWSAVAGITWSAQADGDLGHRMAQVAQRAIVANERVLLIGTDCPQLDAVRLRSAAELLGHCDAVLSPTFDGGYALLGLRRFDQRPFEQMPWSTADVAVRTIERIRQLGWSLTVGDMLHDIDDPADLQWLPDDWDFFHDSKGLT
jgi:rSAM/selenodomain-associated transferase 1